MIKVVGGLKVRNKPIINDIGFAFLAKSYKLGLHRLVLSSFPYTSCTCGLATATTTRLIASSEHQVSLAWLPRVDCYIDIYLNDRLCNLLDINIFLTITHVIFQHAHVYHLQCCRPSHILGRQC